MCSLPFVFSVAAPLLLAASAWAQSDSFSFQDTAGDHLDVLFKGKPVVRYQYAFDAITPERLLETYKPYVHVLDADGKELITKGPGGDFPHHRGLVIGWNKLTTPAGVVDRWHMKGGNILHTKMLSQKAGKDSATFTALIHWQGASDAPVLEEERTITVFPAPTPAYALIEMRSQLKALAGETKLDGDPEHAGIQFRPSMAIDRTQTAYVYPKADAEPHKDRDYPWVAERMTVAGKRYTVAFLNHPDNPRDTPFSAYRDYGRFGAFFHTVIPADGKTTLQVRLLVSEGADLSPEQIQKAANAFTGKNDPTPEVTERPFEKPAEKPAPKKQPAEPKK
jgi:hypothetical protein